MMTYGGNEWDHMLPRYQFRESCNDPKFDGILAIRYQDLNPEHVSLLN